MKFLIWLGCLGAAATLMTIIQHGMGITLGPLMKTLIAILASTLAIRLCKLRNNTEQEEDLEPYNSIEQDGDLEEKNNGDIHNDV